MILVLKSADFSANNIGKVAIDLDERTKAIMSKYGRTFSTEEAVAIQAFMNGLDDSGILSKLRALYMPAFGSSLEDSFVNLASVDYTKDTLQGTSGISFSNGGIINDGSASGFSVTRSTENDIKRNDIFQAVYGNAGTENINQMAVIQSGNLYGPALIGYSLNANVMIKYDAGQINVQATNSDFTHSRFKENQYGIAGINYTYEDLSANRAVFLGRDGYDRCAVTFKKNGTTISYADIGADEVTGNTVGFTQMKSPCKMIVVGKALTDEQLTKFYVLVDDIMKVFS